MPHVPPFFPSSEDGWGGRKKGDPTSPTCPALIPAIGEGCLYPGQLGTQTGSAVVIYGLWLELIRLPPEPWNKAIPQHRLIGISSQQLGGRMGRGGCQGLGGAGGSVLPPSRPGISSPRLSKGWSPARTIGLNSLVNSISLRPQIRTLSGMGKRSRAAIVPWERAERAL